MNKIITLYFLNKKLNSGLVFLGFLSVTLMLLRVKFTHDIYLLFLIWNLFLGYIPYFLSSELKNTIPNTFKFYLLLIGWLVFLPNSFYLLTDFIHLHYNNGLLFLFDALLLGCFSIAGFYSGISSLLHMQELSEMKYSQQKSHCLIVAICFLSSFGVYLGRILRFNSWDILSHPLDLFVSILDSILNPETYSFMLFFGSLITIIYTLSYLLSNKKKLNHDC